MAALLEKHRVEYALIGGYALYANGLIRATGDIDILVRNSPDNNRRWIAALSELPEKEASVLIGESEPFPVEETGATGVIRINDAITVDVMPAACGCAYDDLKPYIGRIEEAGKAINVLDMDGLLLTKQGERAKDKADRLQLELAIKRLRDLSDRPHS